MPLHFTTVILSLKVELAENDLERHLAASPSVVASEVVEQVKQYERDHALGYFPAFEFFEHNGGIEPDLIDAMRNISWVATNMARNEIQIKLRPVFSKMRFDSVQLFAHTLPSVRVNDESMTKKLLEHFSLMKVKAVLNATLLQKISDKKAAEALAKSLAFQRLKESFASVEINSSKAID